jgi:small subunit ribosomal protein S20
VNARARAASPTGVALTSAGPVRRLPAPAIGDTTHGEFVANSKSAEKAARQAEKRRSRNVALRSRMRTAVRNVTTAISGGETEVARSSYQKAVPIIDSLVSKQIIHRNKAARHKSRLSARIRAMQ